MKETDCSPLIPRTSPVTPYSSIVVTHTSPLDTLGCSYRYNMLQPVSKIRLLDIPTIATKIVDVPCSNKMETIHCQGHSGGRSCLHSHLFLISPIFCFLSYPFFHSIWGLITRGMWTYTSKMFPWIPPSRCGSKINLPVKPCRALSSKVSYLFTLETCEGSFGLHTPSTQGCWLASL